MTRSEIIDYIKAFGAKLMFGSTATYENLPDSDTLLDNDIPGWANVKGYVAEHGGTGGGGTPVKYTIDFTNNLNIDWQTAKPSGYSQTYATLFGDEDMPEFTFWFQKTDDEGNPTGKYSQIDPQIEVIIAGIITNVNFAMADGLWRVTFYGFVAGDVGPITNDSFDYTLPLTLS